MLFLAVVLYFLLACLVSWMVLFPAGREFVLRAIAGAGQRMQRQVSQGVRRKGQHVAQMQQTGAASAREGLMFLRRHWLLCVGALLLLCLPPLVAFFSKGSTPLGNYGAPARPVNTQVADILYGEQLVPPPELPPMVFMTVEVEQARPMLASASRDWKLVRPDFQQKLLMVFKIMREQHGYDMAILEGYRSPERQNTLAKLGTGVTNARAYQSWHQYGLAADCAFLREGKIVISEKDAWAMRGYQLYGQVAESQGLTWGGRWKMMDLGHTELRVDGVMKK